MDNTFEGGLRRIEDIVKQLESGDAGLEKTVALYEEAMTLIQGCEAQLKTAEQKVSLIQKKADGSPFSVPFEGAE
jgi:exodeoxyribonuclease VII small subunit